MPWRGGQLMVLHLVSHLPGQTDRLPACQRWLASDLARLSGPRHLAGHHGVAQLLQRLHLVLDHLLDEGVQVDRERKKDLQVRHCKILSMELQENLQFLFIPGMLTIRSIGIIWLQDHLSISSKGSISFCVGIADFTRS